MSKMLTRRDFLAASAASASAASASAATAAVALAGHLFAAPRDSKTPSAGLEKLDDAALVSRPRSGTLVKSTGCACAYPHK